MSNNLTFNPNTYLSDVNSRTELTGEQLKKDYELQVLAKVQNYKLEHPKFSTERICKDLNIAVSSYNRMRRDCGMPPLSQYLVPVKQGKGNKH
jgi:hypothetical protein